MWPRPVISEVVKEPYVPLWRVGYLQIPPQEPRTIITPDIEVINEGVGNGYCTDLVKKLRPDLSYISGNAKTYLSQAKETGDTPRIGAVVQTNESWAGHVAIVTDMTEDSITIKEQNYLGRWVVSTRTISINNNLIQGYIYR